MKLKSRRSNANFDTSEMQMEQRCQGSEQNEILFSKQKTETCFCGSFIYSFFHRQTSVLLMFCTFTFCFPFLAASQQMNNDGDFAIHPSKTLLPVFSEQFDHESEIFEYSNDDPEPNQVQPCQMVARAGRLFNISAVDVFEELRPGILKAGHHLIVQVSSPHLSDWLVYNEESRLLQGVPLLEDAGEPLQILLSSTEDSNTWTTHCDVNVEGQPSPSSNEDLHFDKSLEKHGCFPDEALVVLVLRFDVNSHELIPQNRVRLLEKLNEFMQSLNRCEQCLLSLETEVAQSYSAFLTGVGNINQTQLNFHEVSVSWSLGCASDKLELDVLDPVEKAAQNGSLARITGYDVIEWRVENRKPLTAHSEKLHRMKRRARQGRRKSNKKSSSPNSLSQHAGFDPDLDLEPLNDQQQERISPRVSSVPSYMNRQSPGVPPPTSTLDVFDPSLRPSIPLQSSPIVSPGFSTPSLTPPRNSPPEVSAGFHDFTVHTSTYFEVEIPENVFIDREDGNTLDLSLKIMAIHPSISSKTWLKMSPSKFAGQHIFGVAPPGYYNNKELEWYKFLLIAEDRDRKSTTAAFKVLLDPKPRAANHRITFTMTKQGDQMDDDSFFSYFGKALSRALDGALLSYVLPPGRLTFLKFEQSRSRVVVTWFDNFLGSETKCPRRRLRELSEAMTGTFLKDANTKKISPNSSFKKKFLPMYTIKSIKISLLGPCLSRENVTIEDTALSPSTTTFYTTSTTQLPFFSRTPQTSTAKVTTSTTTTTTTTTTSVATTRKPSTAQTTSLFTTVATMKQPPTLAPRTSTSVVSNTNEASMPELIVEAAEGKLRSKKLEIFSNISELFAPETLEVWAKSGALPRWVQVDSKEWAIYTLPTSAHLRTLETVNSTHKVWTGELHFQKDNGKSFFIPITIYVALLPSNARPMSSVTHMFKMKIDNFNVQNFGVMESLQLLKIIQNIYGDETMEWIYVYPIESGSVLFSWHNETLSHVEFCPFAKIAQLGGVVFQGKKNIKVSDVLKRRLLRDGFHVSKLKLLRMNACALTTVATLTTAAPPPIVNVGAGDITTKEANKKKPEPTNAPQSGGAGIIIVVAVIICILILIIIAVVKCRSRMAASEKENKASGVAFSASEEHPLTRFPPSSTVDRTRNHNTPVVLAGEEEANSLLRSQPDNALSEQPPLTNNREDRETTFPTNDHRTSVNDVRPPPPPYIGKTVST